MALCLPSLCRRPTPTEAPSVPTLSPAAPDVPAAPTPVVLPDVPTVAVDAAVQALRPEVNGAALAALPVFPCAGTDRTTLYRAMHLAEAEWALGCVRIGDRWSLGAAVPMNRQVTAQLPDVGQPSASSLPLRMQLLDGNALIWQQRQDVGLLVPAAIREAVIGGESMNVDLSGFRAEAVNGVRLDISGQQGEDYRTVTAATILFRWRAGAEPIGRVYEGVGGVTESQMDTCSKVTAVEFRIPEPGVLERTERVTARFTSQPLDRALLATLRRGCRSVAPHTERIPIQP